MTTTNETIANETIDTNTAPAIETNTAPAKQSRKPRQLAARKSAPATTDTAPAKQSRKSNAVPTVSLGTLAAWRAHRTMQKQYLPGTTGKQRKAILAKIAEYDAKIAAAESALPPVSKESNADSFSRSSIPALKAHQTMLRKRLRGANAKARAEIQAKIAAYDAKIAALLA